MRRRALYGICMVLFAISGCAQGATPTASGAAAGSPGPSPAAEAPGPSATPVASPTVYAEFHKIADGGHGGAHQYRLPATVSVDYRVSGKCTFEVDIWTDAKTAGFPRFSLAMTGPEQRGTWTFSIAPGTYDVAPSESVGCTFDVVMRSPD